MQADAEPSSALDQSRPARLSIRAIIALLLAIATLPVGVLAIAQGLKAYEETKRLRQVALAHRAVAASRAESGALREAFGSIAALAPLIDLAGERGGCNGLMSRYVEASGDVSFMGVFARDGQMFCGHPFNADLDLSGTDEFRRFMETPRRTVTAYAYGQISREPVLVASAPLSRDGQVVASIAISLPSRYLASVSGQDSDPEGRFALVGANGARVTDLGGGDKDWLPPREHSAALFARGNAPIVLEAGDGTQRTYTSIPLFERDVFAVASWPEERLSRNLTWRQILTILLPLTMWLMAVVVAYYAVDKFALRHVLYLDRLVTAYGRSRRKLRARGVRHAPREFAQLGESFDAMAREIESREEALRGSLDEKNVLLKEVYHRVKNNLQLILSLINLQLREAKDEREIDGLLRLQDRVHGLSAVHQSLYEAERLSAVRIDALIREIATNAKGARGPDACNVALRFDLAEHIEPPDRAMPLALFTTEAIANAFKHALAYGTRGWLSIALRDEGDAMLLEIANEVTSDSPPRDPDRIGLGSQLIDGFARQLRGAVERDVSADRYAVRLRFPKQAPVPQATPVPE